MSAGRTGGADPSLLPLRAAEKPLETQGPLHPSGVPHRERRGRAAPRNSDGSPSLRIQNAQPPGSAASSEVCVARGSGAAGGSGRSEAAVPRGASPGAAGDRKACGGRAHGRSPRSSRVSSWRGRRGSWAVPAGRALAGHLLPRGSEFTPAGAGDPEQGCGHGRATARTCSVSPRHCVVT